MMIFINVAVTTGHKANQLHVNAVKPGAIVTFSALLSQLQICQKGATKITGSFNLISAAQVCSPTPLQVIRSTIKPVC